MNTGGEEVRMCKDVVTAHEDNMTLREYNDKQMINVIIRARF
jgi:hypothetical protein